MKTRSYVTITVEDYRTIEGHNYIFSYGFKSKGNYLDLHWVDIFVKGPVRTSDPTHQWNEVLYVSDDRCRNYLKWDNVELDNPLLAKVKRLGDVYLPQYVIEAARAKLQRLANNA